MVIIGLLRWRNDLGWISPLIAAVVPGLHVRATLIISLRDRCNNLGWISPLIAALMAGLHAGALLVNRRLVILHREPCLCGVVLHSAFNDGLMMHGPLRWHRASVPVNHLEGAVHRAHSAESALIVMPRLQMPMLDARRSDIREVAPVNNAAIHTQPNIPIKPHRHDAIARPRRPDKHRVERNPWLGFVIQRSAHHILCWRNVFALHRHIPHRRFDHHRNFDAGPQEP